jgi:hypothetical protein
MKHAVSPLRVDGSPDPQRCNLLPYTVCMRVFRIACVTLPGSKMHIKQQTLRFKSLMVN